MAQQKTLETCTGFLEMSKQLDNSVKTSTCVINPDIWAGSLELLLLSIDWPAKKPYPIPFLVSHSTQKHHRTHRCNSDLECSCIVLYMWPDRGDCYLRSGCVISMCDVTYENAKGFNTYKKDGMSITVTHTVISCSTMSLVCNPVREIGLCTEHTECASNICQGACCKPQVWW